MIIYSYPTYALYYNLVNTYYILRGSLVPFPYKLIETRTTPPRSYYRDPTEFVRRGGEYYHYYGNFIRELSDFIHINDAFSIVWQTFSIKHVNSYIAI